MRTTRPPAPDTAVSGVPTSRGRRALFATSFGASLRAFSPSKGLPGRWLLAGTALPAPARPVSPFSLRPPELSVGQLVLRSADGEALRLGFAVHANNVNDADLPLADLRFDLAIADRPIAHGNAVEPKIVLPRLGTVDIPFEATVPTPALLELMRRGASLDPSRLPWRVDGSVTWDPLGLPLPFRREGTLDTMRLLRAALSGRR